jgi:hypothetical protein
MPTIEVPFNGYFQSKFDTLGFPFNIDLPEFVANFFEEPFLALPFITRQDIGLAGDGVTDDSFLLNRKMRELWDDGLSAVFWLDPQEGKSFYFNASVDVRSNQWVIFSSRSEKNNITFGPNGRMRIFGGLDEDPDENLPKLGATSTEGSTTLFMGPEPESNASLFQVGQRIIIRGKTDANGVALQKEDNVVTAINTSLNTLTVLNPLEFTYLPVYPPGDFEAKQGIPDRSFVTRLISYDLTANTTVGSPIISLVSTTGLAVGDWMYLFDEGVAKDVGGTSGNFIRQEVGRIIAINGLNVTLNHGVYHQYLTSKTARVTRLDAVGNARITNARVSWNTPSSERDNHAFFVGYAYDSMIDNCHVSDEAGFGNIGSCFRLDIGYNNKIQNCSGRNPYLIGPGLGYGVSMYGSTSCISDNCHMDGMRHGFILFKGTAGCLVTNTTIVNSTISDIDLHGANEIYNTFRGFKIVAGPTISADANDKSAIKLGNEFHLAGASHNIIENGEIDFFDTTHDTNGIDILPTSNYNIVKNVVIKNPSTGILIIDQDDDALPGDANLKAEFNKIENVDIYNASDRAMRLRGNANGSTTRIIKDLELINIKMYGCTRHIDLVQAENVLIKDCQVTRPGDTTTYPYCVDATNVLGLRVSQNYFEKTQRAVRIQDCPSARIIDNTFVDLISVSSAINDVSGNTSATLTPNTDIP